ncbi:MAG TPA: TerC family protein [Rhizomicrobium sp.]
MFTFDHSALLPLLQVLLIDIVLAGDNAIVIGMAAARMPPHARRKVIFWGLVFAVIVRVILATITIELLKIVGLMFAGGILLLWVAWRLWRDLKEQEDQRHAEAARIEAGGIPTPPAFEAKLPVSRGALRRAIARVAIADLSMSLDNVLAVAGAAMNHWWVLTIGLALSIALMGIAANMVAKLLNRFPWISYAGLLIVVYVAMRMIWHGGILILEHTRDSDDAQLKRGGVVTLLEPREQPALRIGVFDAAQFFQQRTQAAV